MVLAEKFCRLSMARYDNEKEREAACRPTYHQLLDCKLALQHRLADTRPDGMLSVRLANNSNSLGHPAIIEIKGDMHASDGIVQADHTYTKVATSKEKSHVYNGSCSPAVLLVLIGPYFFVRGAVHVGVPIIQRLAEPIVLGGETYPEANVKAVANAFEALSRAIDELYDFYSTLVPAATWQPSAHLPKPTLKAAPGQAPPLWLAGLKFVDRLDGGLWHPTIKHKNYFRSLYKAKLGDKPVIVKICEHYGEKAHRLLAGEGLAPQLHHCVELMGWGTMVVMDEVTGRDASVAFPVGMPLPASVKEDVKRAMASLHRAGLVFGDLRRPNVMVVPKARRGHGEEDERSTKIVPEEGAMLVDFDWAGDERVARYPVSINDAIRKSGAEAWGLMSHEHDDYMLTVL
ncbi:hypothetical protein FA95DRAFT_211824 [Auriscalpium vulgare]|uniref:Uncharacterized protein n=1 Tax=Auriscalpium vulgare TaxID=40419 RepID=A0ACB8RLC9_9AGAM|nr:hypothetical protein FA95DRAFT_211824 [Auriscalpium vulgare]